MTRSKAVPERSEPCRKATAYEVNIFELTAKGPHLTVVLNGTQTVDIQDRKFAGGPLALQYGSGVVKFRKLKIKPL